MVKDIDLLNDVKGGFLEDFHITKVNEWTMDKIQDMSALLEFGAIEEAKTEFTKYKAYMQALEDTKTIDTSRKRRLIDIARELFLFYADMEI